MVLLLEDDVFKGSHEKRAILHMYGGGVLWEKNLADGIASLRQHEGEIDWVLLDMFFPLERGGEVFPKCGVKFLAEMDRLGYGSIPVIVCSTVQMQLFAYKNVLNCICYDREMDLEAELTRIWKARK